MVIFEQIMADDTPDAPAPTDTAARLGLKVQWVPAPFDSIIAGVNSGKYDGLPKDDAIANNQAIMAVLCLVIGVKLIGDAIVGFTA